MTTSTPDGGPSPLRAAAASQRVAAHLRDAILSGAIAPGTRIRQEEVAERLGASRLPVREALRILEAEGLTEHEANRGARVPRLTQHEVDVVYRMRERLEPLALAQSIPALDRAAVEGLAEIQRSIEATTDIGDFLALDREFHLRSYAGCGVQQLTATVTRLWNSTQHYRRAYVSLSGPGRMWVINSEHRLILDAVERGDAVDAERFLSGHIRRTRIELGRHPEIFE
ncbi:GntR family transcriptional regulator [Streptomyces sp. NPDC005808]|uniref:GntR family transcriptional regulator n=1 Tax=Streptomyces sp. NPDC005808 TaxID=3364734 RepID=UPI0036A035CA